MMHSFFNVGALGAVSFAPLEPAGSAPAVSFEKLGRSGRAWRKFLIERPLVHIQ